MIDGQSNITLAPSVGQGAHTATVNGTSVDTAGYDSATAYVLPGTWTDGSHTPKLQDSPDNATWTDVAAAQLIGAFTAISSAPTAVNQKVGYVGSNRYLRAVSTVAGATTGAVYAIPIILGRGRKLPQSA